MAMMTRAEIIRRLREEHPTALEYVIETLTDVFLADPEWVKQEARRMQREAKAVKKPAAVADVERQSLFTNVSVEPAAADENKSVPFVRDDDAPIQAAP